MSDESKPAITNPDLPDNRAFPTLQLDPDEYRDDISEFGYTPEQGTEMLQALWNIMGMMVDLGWGVDSVQMLLPDLFEKAGTDSVKSATLNSSQPFNSAVENAVNTKEKSHVK